MGTMPFFLMSIAYLTYFYTNVVGVSAGAVGTVMLISKIFDGISDIIFGNMIDKTKSKHGACRVWLLRSSILMLISFVTIFTVPAVGEWGKIIYIFISYNMSTTVIYTISYTTVLSLPTYLKRDPAVQGRLFTLGNISSSVIGTVVSAISLNLVGFFGGDQKAWIIVGFIYGLFCMTMLLISFFCSKEDPEIVRIKEEAEDKAEKVNVFQVIKNIVCNKYWLIALALSILGTAANTSHTTLTTYYAQYILGDLNLAAVLNSAGQLPGIFAGFFVFPLLAKTTKKNAMFTAGAVLLIGCAIVMLNPKSMTVLLVSYVLFALGNGMAQSIIYAMLGNCVEYGAWKTGVRSQAAIMGASTAGMKVGAGLISGAMGWGMDMVGFDGTAATQTAAAIEGIKNLFIVIPIVVAILMIVLTAFYTLDKYFPTIMKELHEREGK